MGDLIRLEVAGDVLDEVQIERLDRIDAIEPLTPARFEVIPEVAGVYPIRLIEADRRIGRLDITAVGSRRAAWASCPGMKRPVPSHHGHGDGLGLAALAGDDLAGAAAGLAALGVVRRRRVTARAP